MTYVDAPIWPYRGMMMCHLFADSLPELHAMAVQLGVRRWFQDKKTPHYDICRSKRALAIKLGAREIDRKQTVALIMKLRKKKPVSDWDADIPKVPKHLAKKPPAKAPRKPVKPISSAPPAKIAPKTGKASKPNAIKFSPDEAAERYLREQDVADNAAAAFAETKQGIISAAAQVGCKDENRRVIKGSRFEVGFLETDPAPKVDLDLAKKILPAPVLQRCIVNTITIDEKQVEQLVEAGVISATQLKQICKKPASQRRIYVRKL